MSQTAIPTWRQQWQNLPVWYCGFRPFYVLASSAAILNILIWLSYWLGWLRPEIAVFSGRGGPIVWHGQQMIFGFSLAALAGFMLTAAPGRNSSQQLSKQALQLLVLFWCLARLSEAGQFFWGFWLVIVANLLFDLLLCRAALPARPILKNWRQAGFGAVLFLLTLTHLGYFLALLLHKNPLLWLDTAVDFLMILVLLATARIGMMIMNNRLEPNPEQARFFPPFMARLPFRYVTTTLIFVYIALRFMLSMHYVADWVALAIAASVFNMLNDWHIGRQLFKRWGLMLYSGLLLMGIGYFLLGAGALGIAIAPSAARHVLAIGVVGVLIFTVMMISGTRHSGRWMDKRSWIILALLAIILAAFVRLLAGLPQTFSHYTLWLEISCVCWLAAFLMYAWYTWPVLLGPRPDILKDCSGPQN